MKWFLIIALVMVAEVMLSLIVGGLGSFTNGDKIVEMAVNAILLGLVFFPLKLQRNPFMIVTPLFRAKVLERFNYAQALLFNRPWFKYEGGLAVSFSFTKFEEHSYQPKAITATGVVHTTSKEDKEISLALKYTISGLAVPDFDLLETFAVNKLVLEKRAGELLFTKLEKLSVAYDPMEMIQLTAAVELYFNCLARLSDKKMPHLHGTDWGYSKDLVPTAEILGFYSDESRMHDLKEMLKEEENHRKDKSSIELSLGVDLKGWYTLSSPELTPESEKALSAKKELRLKLKMGEMRITQALTILKLPGNVLTLQEILNEMSRAQVGETIRTVNVLGGREVGVFVSDDNSNDSSRPPFMKGGNRGKR